MPAANRLRVPSIVAVALLSGLIAGAAVSEAAETYAYRTARGLYDDCAAPSSLRNGAPSERRARCADYHKQALNAWNSALCSESTGSTLVPRWAARRMNRAPAQTRHSLLASATVPPRSTAASVGSSPVAPAIAAMTHSAGRSAASIIAFGPAAASMPLPARSSLRSR